MVPSKQDLVSIILKDSEKDIGLTSEEIRNYNSRKNFPQRIYYLNILYHIPQILFSNVLI